MCCCTHPNLAYERLTMTFNLLDESWIPVILDDGSTDEVSLRSAFTEGRRIRRIAADLPTQSFAILRIMLAICHDAIGFHDDGDIDDLLHEGIDVDSVLDYLDELHDRFDLFHPQRPFFQVATLRTANDAVAPLEKLIADVPNGDPFLTTRIGAGLDEISAAEAARWLVHCQTFDPSGIRSAAVGDPETKGGKGYPIGPGWSGRIGGVVLHGRDLLETLAFNITPTEENDADRPAWALEQPHTEQRALDVTPPGPVSVLTWQARRIRLVGNRDGVTGVVLAQGDQLKEQNRHDVEYMTAWRYSAPQTAKFKIPVYMPRKHDPARAAWRGMPALLSQATTDVDGSPSTLPPRTIENLRAHSLGGKNLDLRAVVETIGMDYGPQEATVSELVHDTIDLRLSLIADEAASVRVMLDDSINTTDRCVWTLGRMARNIAAAAGDFDGLDGARDAAMLRAWAALDAPARAWISGLDASTDIDEERKSWQQQIRTILTDLANELASTCSPVAIVGRKTKHGYMTAALAEVYFRKALRDELPLAFPTPEKKEPADE